MAAMQGPGIVQRFRADGIILLNTASSLVTRVTASTNCQSGILVSGSSDKNPRLAIGRCRDTRHKAPRRVEQNNTVCTKPLYDARSLYRLVALVDGSDAVLIDGQCGVANAGALATAGGITLAGDRKSIQLEREARCTKLDARRR